MRSSSSLTLGEQLCFAFLPLVPIFEALVSLVAGCFQHLPKMFLRRSMEIRQDFVKLAEESNCFTVDEIEELYEVYKKLSRSIIDDGLIHKEELQFALFMTTAGENLFLDRVFDLFDEKKNGVIEFEEFIHTLSVFHPDTPLENKIEFAFRLYDLGQTGFIEREEVKQMVCAILIESEMKLANDDLEALIDRTFADADADGDGKISPSDWQAFVIRHPSLLKNMTVYNLKQVSDA